MFYVLASLLFALGADPRDPALATFAPSVVWLGAVLAALVGMERLFQADFEDGSLETLFLSPVPAALWVAAKAFAHWLLIGAPLVLLGPLLALMLGASPAVAGTLAAGLALGTPALVLIGGFAAALTLGSARAGVLVPVLVLPLMAPLVIFGAGAARASAQGLATAAPLYFLAALLVLMMTLLPWAIAAALRNALE